jgi:hypothetical protein
VSAGAEELVICRCEHVTLSALAQAAGDLDVRSLRQLKLWTRAGMGICQGRVCRPALESLADVLNLEQGPAELRLRPPLRPVSMAALAGGEDV